jgi:multiple sugar transport system permease protein
MAQDMLSPAGAVVRAPTRAPDRRHRQRHSLRAQRRRFAYLLVTPAALLMLAVHIIPAVIGIWMSLLRLNQFTLLQFLQAPFVGLENFWSILFDPSNPLRSGLGLAVRNTIVYTIVTVTGTLVSAMAVALLLNRQFRGRRWARTFVLVPWVIPSYVVGVLWGFMWQSDVGIINRVLVDWVGVVDSRPFWTSGPTALFAVIVPTIWRGFPFVMMIFLAGLQTIPEELYEAAEVDGAGAWRKFRAITLPMMRPVIAIQLLFGIIYSVYSYNIVAMMFGGGNAYPGKWADLAITSITRQSFGAFLFGYGAAGSTLLMLAMMVVVAIWYRIYRKDLAVTR